MNYGSFQSGTEQGLHRNEQPPPTQQGAFPKGKGAVVANAVTPRRLGLHLERLIPYQPGEDRRYPGEVIPARTAERPTPRRKASVAACGRRHAKYTMILPYSHSPSVKSVAGNG